MSIKKSHIYSLLYKGKYVINYAWREPLNKDKWVLTNDENTICPLPDELLKQLVDDPQVTITDMGAI